jgi:hypothetical protein
MVVEHFDSIGSLRGKEVRAPALGAFATILVSLGADKILFPSPGVAERERIIEGMRQLPIERRRVIKRVDEKGKILSRIREYLQPLRDQAKKWPETAFAGFVEDPLYHLAIACKYNASVCEGGLVNAHSFIGIIDPTVFRGEARFRLSELSFLLTRYYPMCIGRLAVSGLVADDEVRKILSNILDSAEFEKVVASEGRLGYLKYPDVGLRRLKKAVVSLASRQGFKTAVKAGIAVSEFSPPPANLSVLKDILPGEHDKRPHSPLFLDLPPSTAATIARSALAEAYPQAIPLRRTLYVNEYARGGRVSHAWLNKGEEKKLLENPRRDLAYRIEKARSARRALSRFAVGAS